jgi:hypothetical protein
MTKQEVLNLMSSSKSEMEWDANCDKVKKLVRDGVITDRSGDYPSYWFSEVIMSGLLRSTRRKYNW